MARAKSRTGRMGTINAMVGMRKDSRDGSRFCAMTHMAKRPPEMGHPFRGGYVRWGSTHAGSQILEVEVQAVGGLAGKWRLRDGDAIALVDCAALHDPVDVLHAGDVLERVTLNSDEVCVVTGLDGAGVC